MTTTMITLLHVIAVVCIIIITACTTSLWHDATPTARSKVIGGIIAVTTCIICATTFVWLLFLAPTNIY